MIIIAPPALLYLAMLAGLYLIFGPAVLTFAAAAFAIFCTYHILKFLIIAVWWTSSFIAKLDYRSLFAKSAKAVTSFVLVIALFMIVPALTGVAAYFLTGNVGAAIFTPCVAYFVWMGFLAWLANVHPTWFQYLRASGNTEGHAKA